MVAPIIGGIMLGLASGLLRRELTRQQEQRDEAQAILRKALGEGKDLRTDVYQSVMKAAGLSKKQQEIYLGLSDQVRTDPIQAQVIQATNLLGEPVLEQQRGRTTEAPSEVLAPFEQPVPRPPTAAEFGQRVARLRTESPDIAERVLPGTAALGQAAGQERRAEELLRIQQGQEARAEELFQYNKTQRGIAEQAAQQQIVLHELQMKNIQAQIDERPRDFRLRERQVALQEQQFRDTQAYQSAMLSQTVAAATNKLLQDILSDTGTRLQSAMAKILDVQAHGGDLEKTALVTAVSARNAEITLGLDRATVANFPRALIARQLAPQYMAIRDGAPLPLDLLLSDYAKQVALGKAKPVATFAEFIKETGITGLPGNLDTRLGVPFTELMRSFSLEGGFLSGIPERPGAPTPSAQPTGTGAPSPEAVQRVIQKTRRAFGPARVVPTLMEEFGLSAEEAQAYMERLPELLPAAKTTAQTSRVEKAIEEWNALTPANKLLSRSRFEMRLRRLNVPPDRIAEILGSQ